jgi:hypothetical protein
MLSKDLQFEINKNIELKREYDDNIMRMNSEIEGLYENFNFYKKENFDLKEKLQILLKE